MRRRVRVQIVGKRVLHRVGRAIQAETVEVVPKRIGLASLGHDGLELVTDVGQRQLLDMIVDSLAP